MDAVIKNTFAEVFINGKHFFSLQAADFEDADNGFWYTAFKNVVIEGDKARAQLSERAVDLIKRAAKKYTDASDIIVEVAASDIIPVTTEQEESEEAYNAYIQVVMLYSAIASTGDGKSQETAFHVICVSDEYALMRMFGFSPKSQALLEKKGRSYDRMDLEENEYGLEALYFDITVSFEAMNKMFGH